MLRIVKKLVKVCLHFSYAVQISLQFDEFFSEKISKLYFRLDLRFLLKRLKLLIWNLMGHPVHAFMLKGEILFLVFFYLSISRAAKILGDQTWITTRGFKENLVLPSSNTRGLFIICIYDSHLVLFERTNRKLCLQLCVIAYGNIPIWKSFRSSTISWARTLIRHQD